MKKMKRCLSCLLTVLMLLSCLPLAAIPATAQGPEPLVPLEQETPDTPQAALPPLPKGFHFTGRFFEDCEKGTLYYIENEASALGLTIGKWIDRTGEEVRDWNDPAVAADASGTPNRGALPSSYDARDEGLVTPVESQIGGSCWAHAAAACMETGAIKKGLATNETIDLSEYFLVWYSKNGYYDNEPDARNDGLQCDEAQTKLLGEGGNVSNVVDATRNFSGPVAESAYPLTATTSSALYTEMQNTFTFSQRFSRDLSVTGYHRVALTNDAIKNAVLQYGAVQISYYHHNSYYAGYWNSNPDPCAYYYPLNTTANHAVVIIGWDDSFSKENFLSSCQPSSDGAWLVKNSFGADWGDAGFFWLSYEDKSIYEAYTLEVSSRDEFRNAYFYDGFGSYSSTFGDKAANVFVARGNEYLTKVSPGGASAYRSGDAYKFSIYKDLPETVTDPTAGTLVYTQTGLAPNSAYIDVNGKVDLRAGEKFSVVFEDLNTVYTEAAGGSHYWIVTLRFSSQVGQSFYEKNGVWIDSSTENRNNVCVRAITKPTSAGPYTVSFRCPYGDYTQTAVANGGTVALPQTADHTWVFTYDGAPFDGTGVDRDMTVLSHCYPNAGTIKEGYPCTTEYRCIYCGMEMLPSVTLHTFTQQIIAPAADHPGYTKHTCQICGYEKVTDPVFQNADAVGGVIEENFVWQISDGVLSVCGQGALPDRTAEAPSPWQAYEADVTSLIVHEGVTSTGEYGFDGLTQMTQLQLPLTLTKIAKYAFQYARSLVVFNAPANLEEIASYAFRYVDKLEEIHFNDKLTELGGCAFAEAPKLKEMIIPASMTSSHFYPYYHCGSADLIVEEGVTDLDYTPYYPTHTGDALSKIVIPSTVSRITSSFYYYLYPSKAFVVSPDNPYYSSRDGVLFNKDQTTLVYYPAMRRGGNYYKAPASVTALASDAFAYNYAAYYVDLSDCAAQTLADAFYKPHNLKNLNLPENLTGISNGMLNATSVQALYVPASVTQIAANSFGGCTNLTIYTDAADAPVVAVAEAAGIPYEVLPGHTHDYATTAYTKAATCGAAGYVIKTCLCGNFSYTETPPTGSHKKTNPVVTEATCEAQGYTTYTCTTCGTTYQDDYTDALGHAFEWVTDTPATCNRAGVRHEECTRCHATRSENTAIPATENHTAGTPTETVLTAATCGTAGSKQITVKCTVCGATIRDTTETIPATGSHDWGWVTDMPATCGNAGVKHEECTVCHTKRNENTAIAATGNHTAGTPTETVLTAATCGAAGSKQITVKCTVCGATIRETTETIPATGSHDWGWVTDTPATCSNAGVKHEECNVCHTKRNENTAIAATGVHVYSAATVKDTALKAAATCQADAVYYYSCKDCGAVEHNDSHTFAATGTKLRHVSSDWIIDSDATCKVEGSRHTECTVCHTVLETQTIGKLPHTPQTVPGKAATCKATGLTDGSVCSVCGDVLQAQTVIEKKAHSYDAGTITKQPTCTADGVKTCTCTVCGDKKTEAVGKLGHSWGGWTTVKEPTCTETGVQQRTCTRDGSHKETRTLEKKGHTDNGSGYCKDCGADLRSGQRCKYCGEIHTGAFGWLIKFFHSILALFKR